MNKTVASLVTLLAIGSSAPALAFQCPNLMADIDAALESAELTDEQRAQVEELRAEGERLHSEGDHQASVDALTEAQAILGN